MMDRKTNFAGGALACMLAGAAAVALPAPAAAQDRDRLEMFGPGDRGWFEGRPEVFGEGRRGWFEEGDSHLRDHYDRGYRMGRDDERRAQGQASWRRTGEAMDHLEQARRQMSNGDYRAAWISLGQAETRLLTRASMGKGGEQAATGGAVGAIRDARRALQERRMNYAREQIARAETLVERGRLVGDTVAGRSLSGAGIAGPAEPMWQSGARGSGSDSAGGGRQ